MLEPLSTLCVSFLFFSYYIFFIADNISISMYITCFILCLFSALSCGVSALQISMIIIIIIIVEKTQTKDSRWSCTCQLKPLDIWCKYCYYSISAGCASNQNLLACGGTVSIY